MITVSINVGLVYPGFKVEYIKDDVVKNTINIDWIFQGNPTPMQPYVINEYGKWAVRITDIRTSIQRSCSPYQTAYDELTISPMPQKFTVPNNLIFCSNIVTKVKVNNTDSLNNPIYAWYPNSNSSIEMGRTKSNSSLIINDNVLAGNTSKTIYVEEIHEKSGAIFDSAQVKNHISDVPNAKEYSMYMEVLEKLTLDSLSFLYKTFSSSSTTYSGKIQIYAPMTSNNSFAPDKTKILFESQSFDVISNSNTYKKYNVPMNITLEPGFYFIGISNNPQGYVGIFDQTNGFAYSGYNFSNNTPILDKNKDHSLKIWGSSNYNNTAQSGVVGIFFDIKYRTTKKFCDRIPVYINKDCNCTKPSSVSISGNTNTCSGETIELKGSSSHTNGIKQNINFVWYKKGTTAGAYAPSPITNKSIPNVQSSDTSTWILRVEDGSYGLSDCYVEASTKFNIGSKLNFDNVSTNPINLHIYEEFNMEAEISGAKIDSVIFLVDNKITTKTYSAPYKSSKYNAPINFPVYVYAYNKGCKSEFYDQFGSAMSVNNTQGTNKQISLYPNPFSTTTSINTINNMEYVIIDNQGRIVETGIGENTTAIGEKLPKGAYIVKITTNNENAVYSILKL
jgi:hypothetical protein